MKIIHRNLGMCVFILLILAVGAVARFKDLAWHFTFVDDIGVAASFLKHSRHDWTDFFIIPREWTYAPLQFLLLPALIHDQMTYRELLFWGRLPSCFFGVLALPALVWFYREWEDRFSAKVFFPLSLLACSWEFIIHAKQMHNYALGGLSVLTGFILLVRLIKQPALRTKSVFAMTFGLAVLCHAHYQFLFVLPAFYGTLYLYFSRKEGVRSVLVKLLASAAALGILLVPMWFFFLRRVAGMGINEWNRGVNQEYILTFGLQDGLWQRTVQTLSFVGRNFAVVFESNMSFIPENHSAFGAMSLFLLVLFSAGVVSFFFRKAPLTRYVGVFMGLCALTWFSLVMAQKISLSPTRHSLFLLPWMVITVAEGADFLWQNSAGRLRIVSGRAVYSPVLAACVLAMFAAGFPVFLNERRDLFVEEDVLKLVQKYDVVKIWSGPHTDFLDTMKSVHGFLKQQKTQSRLRRVMWYSHNGPLDFPEYLKMLKSPYDYEVIYQREIDSDREVDFSKKAKNLMARNRLFIYIAKKARERL